MAKTTFVPDETWAPKITSDNQCCADYRNLVTIESRESLQVRQCQVCNRRHFRAKVDIGSIKMVGVDTNGS